MRFLTTTTKPNFPAWGQQTQLLPGWFEEAQLAWTKKQASSLLSDIKWAFRLFFAAKQFDGVITGFERSAWLFALLRRFTFTHEPAHVFLDAYPTLPARGLARVIRRWLFRQIFLSSDRVVTFSNKQRDLWSSLFRLPDSCFEVIPYWATAAVKKEEDGKLGSYIFAGGDEERDYRTLIEAVRHTPYRLIIAALRRDHFAGIEIPQNVDIRTVPHDEFVKLLRFAGLVVVPLRAGTIRYAGQQTYLNAMLLKKPVIVADEGAEEYIDNGRTGVIVGPGCKEELIDAIDYLMRNRDVAEQMGLLAHESAKRFSPERYFDAVLNLTSACARRHALDI